MKSYIVEFTHRVSGNTFLKFGHTKYSDVMRRFEFDPEQYQDYLIQVLASIKHTTLEEAESVESDFLKKYPKNLSLPRYFSGITEIYEPEDKQERAKILREFYILKEDVEKKMVTSEDINDATQKRFFNAR
jgi:glycine/serine hydroxymethyltransferase